MFTPTQALALASFAFVSSITPGPNNMMAAASGANVGLLKSLPQIAGVTLGFVVLMWATAAGVAAFLVLYPMALRILSWVGFTYMFYLSYRLLHAALMAAPEPGAQISRPLTFFESAVFQFINPKAWMMALFPISTFLHSTSLSDWLLTMSAISLLFSIVNFPCVLVWAGIGAGLREWLQVSWRMRVFNASMALLLIATAIWMTFLMG